MHGFRPYLSCLINPPNLGVHWRYVSHDKIQNFSSISLNLCLLDQTHTGTWGVNDRVNNTLVESNIIIKAER